MLMKIFRGFLVFEYALWQKMKTWKCRKSAEGFLDKKKVKKKEKKEVFHYLRSHKTVIKKMKYKRKVLI